MRLGHLWRGAIVRFLQRGYEGLREGTVVMASCAGVLLEVDGERVRLPRTQVIKIRVAATSKAEEKEEVVMAKVKPLKRIFGADGMSKRGARQLKVGVSRQIDAEARRVAKRFEGYMPSDVVTMFHQALSMYMFGHVSMRKFKLIQERRRAKRK